MITRVDSLVMLTRRDHLPDTIKTNRQVELEKAYQGVFGVACSNRIIAGSLTREHLQHEVNPVLPGGRLSGGTIVRL